MLFSITNYATYVLAISLLIGVAFYIFDRKVGIHIYRFLYDAAHGNPMPKGEERGFIFGQSRRRGIVVAGFISTVYLGYAIKEFGLSINLFAELLIWLLMPTLLIIGFRYLGPLIFKLIKGRDAVFERIDKIGDRVDNVDVNQVAKAATQASLSRMGKLLGSLPHAVSKGKPPVAEPVPAAPIEPESPTDVNAAIRKYRKGK